MFSVERELSKLGNGVALLLNICWAIWKGRIKMVLQQINPNPVFAIEGASLAHNHYWFAMNGEPVCGNMVGLIVLLMAGSPQLIPG